MHRDADRRDLSAGRALASLGVGTIALVASRFSGESRYAVVVALVSWAVVFCLLALSTSALLATGLVGAAAALSLNNRGGRLPSALFVAACPALVLGLCRILLTRVFPVFLGWPKKMQRLSAARIGRLPVLLGLVVMSGLFGAAFWPTKASVTEPAVRGDFRNVPRLRLDLRSVASTDALLLSSFEGTEPVQTENASSVDPSSHYEGQSSLLLESRDRRQSTAVLPLRHDLGSFDAFEVMIDVKNAADIETFVLRFRTSAAGPTFEYPLPALGDGWTPVQMMKKQFLGGQGPSDPGWRAISTAEFVLRARPGTEARVNVDLFLADRTSGDWRSRLVARPPASLALIRRPNGATGALVRDVRGKAAVLADIGDVRNFTLAASLSPLTIGRGGLLLRSPRGSSRGLLFVLNGSGSNRWQLLRISSRGGAVLREGSVGSTVLQPDDVYRLRARVKDARVTLYFAQGRGPYRRLASVVDRTFPFGAVGIRVIDDAAYVVEDFQYERI